MLMFLTAKNDYLQVAGSSPAVGFFCTVGRVGLMRLIATQIISFRGTQVRILYCALIKIN